MEHVFFLCFGCFFFFIRSHFLSLSHGNSSGGDGLFGIAGCCLLSAESKCHLFFPFFLLLRALQGALPVGCRVGNKTEKKKLRTKNTSSRKQRWGKTQRLQSSFSQRAAAEGTPSVSSPEHSRASLFLPDCPWPWAAHRMGWDHNHPTLHPGSCAPSSPAAIPVLPGTALPSCSWI